jgi:hypothetical protein
MVSRRNRPRSLQPLDQPTWLVVRDQYSNALEWRAIASGVDLRTVVGDARTERMKAGWSCTEVGPADNGFFADRANVRESVYVERFDPAGPGPPGHSDTLVPAP